MIIFFWITFIFHLFKDCNGGPYERRLLSNLLFDYNPIERPVVNESEPILVSFHLTLQQIIDLDEKNQILQTSIWLNMEWIDSNLRWNASDYPGVEKLRISSHKIWTPDVLLYNSADDKIDSTLHTNVVVNNNGSCLWVPPGIFRSTCKVDITWFPFDDQKCVLKFGSWSYDGLALDLRLSNENGGDTSTYIPSGEWILIGVPAKRRVLQYTCCPETYVDITFTVHIRRRTLYYTFNLIVPCVLISSMTLLGFALPPDSGEKLTLGVTILLSMTVFMLQLSETLPPTSESISIIGTYFACIMIMVAFSVVMTVVVLNFHHRATSEYQEMPPLVRRVILIWLPWILRMEKPGIKPPPNTNKGRSSSSPSPKASGSHKPCRQDMSYTISSNIKGYCDLDRRSHSNAIETKWGGPVGGGGVGVNVGGVGGIPDDDYLASTRADGCGVNTCLCCYNNLKSYNQQVPYNGSGIDETDLISDGTQTLITEPAASGQGNAGGHHVCCSLLCKGREVTAILRELRFITNRMRKVDEIEDIIGEWKFAAMVMDRLCLIVFSSFTAVSTAACLLPPANLH